MFPRVGVVWSIFQRNLSSYFSGVLGYLVIVAFVAFCGFFAFNGQFFTDNEPNLNQLTNQFPLLLLLFIPAITMGVWSDEKKTGTDELLFTLPTTTLEVLLGKYIAVAVVYTIALVFSMAHVVVLSYLGNPDYSLLASTYFGYWLAGSALIAAGMYASSLTRSMAVAFVLGVIFCAIPLYIDQLMLPLSAFASGIGLAGIAPAIENSGRMFSIATQFNDFGIGIVPITSILFFIGLKIFFLYLNYASISKRNWQPGHAMGLHFFMRCTAIAVIFSCVVGLLGYFSMRFDLTSERLYSLSNVTRTAFKELDNERPIEILAYVSPEVPPEYVDTKRELLGLLRQFDNMGGSKVTVRIVDVEPSTDESDEAEKFGIEPVPVMSEVDGQRTTQRLYLGAVLMSSYDKVVIPFFGKGLPIEYELTRSIRTIAEDKRLTIGILQTDANVSGGRDWAITTELKKQYNVENISPSTKINQEDFDVLLAVMPSSLTEPEMANLVEYVGSGEPALIFDDPFPLAMGGGFGVSSAPRQPKPRPGGAMAQFGGGQQAPPKSDGGRASKLLSTLGIRWKYDRVAFDLHNPHPQFGQLPAEYVFVTADTENAFNKDEAITETLQQILLIYGGTVEQDKNTDRKIEFTPLLQTGGDTSGLLEWEEFTQSNMDFRSMSQTAVPRNELVRSPDKDSHAVAARIEADEDGNKLNAIYVADVDMISDLFFQIRTQGDLDIEFDNISFILNAVDVLADEEELVKLRSRRARHRTLKTVEGKIKEFREAAAKREKQADEDAKEKLEKRESLFAKQVESIEKNEDLDPITKVQEVEKARQNQSRKLQLEQARIDQEKELEIERSQNETVKQVKTLRDQIRVLAVILPAIPALLIGGFVFFIRLANENANAGKRRKVKTIN